VIWRRLVEELPADEQVVDRLFDLHEYASDIECNKRRLQISVHEQLHTADEVEEGIEQLRATVETVVEAFGAAEGHG